MRQERLSREQAFQKIKQFCAYQERCHQEAKEKLYGFGLYKEEVEGLIARLIEENYLDEERFAIQFAGGKFRMKHWGKKKIEYELRQKQVSPYCIRKALAQIREADYLETLEKLAIDKYNSVKGSDPEGNNHDPKRKDPDPFTSRAKVTAYLLQKGFEGDNIRQMLEKIGN
jgi:regulatory protein